MVASEEYRRSSWSAKVKFAASTATAARAASTIELLGVERGRLGGDRGGGGRDIGFGGIDRDPEIPIVDPRERLPGLDRLVVADQNLGDVAGNLRRDRGVVGLDIGVVGRNLEPADGPIAIAVVAGAREREQARGGEQRFAQDALSRLGRGAPASFSLKPGAATSAEIGRSGAKSAGRSVIGTAPSSFKRPVLARLRQFGNLLFSKIGAIGALSRRIWKMIMVQNNVAEAPKRCRGRPQVRCDEDTRALIIEAAAQEFQAKGYEATSIAAVAQHAGVSTKTLYRLIPTKADLFASVITDRIGRFVLEVDLAPIESADAEQAIARMLTAYGMLTLEPRTIALTRLVLGESRAFPEVGAAFYEKADPAHERGDGGGAEAPVRARPYLPGRAADAVSMLRGMMTMEPQRAAMLGQREPPDAVEIEDRATRCARVFLHGCMVRPQRKSSCRRDSALGEADRLTLGEAEPNEGDQCAFWSSSPIPSRRALRRRSTPGR